MMQGGYRYRFGFSLKPFKILCFRCFTPANHLRATNRLSLTSSA